MLTNTKVLNDFYNKYDSYAHNRIDLNLKKFTINMRDDLKCLFKDDDYEFLILLSHIDDLKLKSFFTYYAIYVYKIYKIKMNKNVNIQDSIDNFLKFFKENDKYYDLFILSISYYF